MTIDEALEKLPEGEKNGSELEKNIEGPVDNTIVSTLKTYPSAVYKIKKKIKRQYNPKVIEELAEFIRFNHIFHAKIDGIPRSEISRVIGNQNPTLKSLLEETDLKNSIPDPFCITDKDHYESFPVDLRKETRLNYDDFVNFEENAKGCFVIPNLSFMSLFIKNGQDLRDYATIARQKESPIFYHIQKFIDTDFFDENFEPFNSEDLKKFHETFKDRNIAPMINQINELSSLLKNPGDWYFYSYGRSNGKAVEPYKNLKNYNPQLIAR